jgi:hypothetical protein
MGEPTPKKVPSANQAGVKKTLLLFAQGLAF